MYCISWKFRLSYFPKNSSVVANKRNKNLHQLIVKFGPCNIKMDQLDITEHGHLHCGCKCDSCDNFVMETLYATLKKHNSKSTKTVLGPPKIVKHIKKSSQGVISWFECKSWLRNYNYHRHFEQCRIFLTKRY